MATLKNRRALLAEVLGRSEDDITLGDGIKPSAIKEMADELGLSAETWMDANTDQIANWIKDLAVKHGMIADEMVVKMYAHGSDEGAWEQGRSLGMEGEALDMFSRTLYEVEFDVKVNTLTGMSEIIAVNGRPLGPKPTT